MRLMFAIALTLVSPAPAASAEPNAVRAWRAANETALMREYLDFVALPNVTGDAEAIERNAGHLLAMLERRGLAPRRLEVAGAPPAVYGEWRVPGAERTLVFYAHFDGQPVDAGSWHSDPFEPTWRDDRLDRGGRPIAVDPEEPIDPDWRLYARSAADDKAGVMAILAAVSALRATGTEPAYNLKFFFEGEEESGSPNLARVLDAHRERLAADAWVICDGPVHASGRPQIVYGVRGDLNVDLVVYGPKRPLHSGHYGDWAPNPASLLARLLASLHDTSGLVAVPGWYDDVLPLGEAERAALRAAPDQDEALRRELGIAESQLAGRLLVEAINLPTLNINGMRAAEVGAQASNKIPTEARATLDLRLVLGNTPDRQFERLKAHVAAQGFHVIDRAPTDAERLAHPRIATLTRDSGGYAAWRTPMDHPIARDVAAAIRTVADEPPVELPTMGGSLPLVVIHDVLGAPSIVVPIANHDNNQHAEDENLRIGHLWDGIAIMAAIMRGAGDAAR